MMVHTPNPHFEQLRHDLRHCLYAVTSRDRDETITDWLGDALRDWIGINQSGELWVYVLAVRKHAYIKINACNMACDTNFIRKAAN